jgi:RNA-directed DNA polymerase
MPRIGGRRHGDVDGRGTSRMEETKATTVATPTIEDWTQAPWRKLERHVYRLQKRIYHAQSRGQVKDVHSVQRLLMRSCAARMLAVRRVTQDNQGKKTAGVDGVKAVGPMVRLLFVERLRHPEAIHARPVRRVYIPKPGKDEQRPLGIPVMLDRAHQTLVKLALEPQWEARFEPNSYGFRPGRSCHDAIEAIFTCIATKDKFVLDADIQGCFDNIDHQALLGKLDSIPAIRRATKAWLQAGVLHDGVFAPTSKGSPQGGCISPLLANIALHGLEGSAVSAYQRWAGGTRIRPALIRYADLCGHRHKSAYAGCRVMPTVVGDRLADPRESGARSA